MVPIQPSASAVIARLVSHELLLRLLKNLVDVLRLGDVAVHGDALRAVLLAELLGKANGALFVKEIVRDDVHALFRENVADARAESGGSAGDDGGFALQI